MANIKRNIRFYQPNDPYFWQVDNLPLTDLLANDIVLENRLEDLETSITDIGGTGGAGGTGTTDGTGSEQGALSGTMALGSIGDLKAYSIPIEGQPNRFGKIYVRPGKFTARVQVPATRENGARMMRDKGAFFNNDPNGLSTTDIAGQFVRETRGLARTAVVEWLADANGADRYISIPAFDPEDFNNGDAPLERLDLIYIKGMKSLDCDGDAVTTPSNYAQNSIPRAKLGIIKGAYFRTDIGGGLHTNGSRFTDANARLNGRTTGMSNGELPSDTILPNFGTVPMPEDLVNFAWHRNYQETASEVSNSELANKQIDTEAAFCIPIAYVRVGRSHREGDPISPDRVVDIRPFFRTAELDYSERAAIAASVGPNGHNPFITKFHLRNKWIDPLSSTVHQHTAIIGGLTGTDVIHSTGISENSADIGLLKTALSGTTTVLGPHEDRIQTLETGLGNGGGGNGGAGVTITLEHFVNIPYVVFTERTTQALLGFGPENPANYNITEAIPALHRDKLVAVQYKVQARHHSSAGGHQIIDFFLKGGTLPFTKIGVCQTHDDRNVTLHSGLFGVTTTNFNDELRNSFDCYVTAERPDVYWSMWIDGYIWREEVTV